VSRSFAVDRGRGSSSSSALRMARQPSETGNRAATASFRSTCQAFVFQYVNLTSMTFPGSDYWTVLYRRDYESIVGCAVENHVPDPRLNSGLPVGTMASSGASIRTEGGCGALFGSDQSADRRYLDLTSGAKPSSSLPQ
jgi:hypothetical protein